MKIPLKTIKMSFLISAFKMANRNISQNISFNLKYKYVVKIIFKLVSHCIWIFQSQFNLIFVNENYFSWLTDLAQGIPINKMFRASSQISNWVYLHVVFFVFVLLKIKNSSRCLHDDERGENNFKINFLYWIWIYPRKWNLFSGINNVFPSNFLFTAMAYNFGK